MAKGVTLNDVMGVLNQIKASVDKGKGAQTIIMGASAEPQQKNKRGSDPIQILKGFEKKLSSIQTNVAIMTKQNKVSSRSASVRTETLPVLPYGSAKSVKEFSGINSRTIKKYSSNVQSILEPFVSIGDKSGAIKAATVGIDILNSVSNFISNDGGSSTIKIFGKTFKRKRSILHSVKSFNRGKSHIKKLGSSIALILKPFEKVSLERKKLSGAMLVLDGISEFLNKFGGKSARISRKLNKAVRNGIHKSIDTILFGKKPGGGIVGSITKLSGKKKGKILNGLGLLSLIASGIGAFAGVMAISSPLLAIGVVGATAFGLSMLALGGSLAFLGKFSKPILKGIGILAIISASTMLFSLSLGMSIATFALAGDGNVRKASLYTLLFVGTIAAVGGVTAALGVGAKVTLIGSLVLTMMGAGVTLFGVGVSLALNAMRGFKKDDADGIGSIITDVGTSIAKVGLMSPAIMLGIASSMMIGGALSNIARGIRAFTRITKNDGIVKNGKISDEFTNSLTATITMIGGAFASIGSSGQVEKRFAFFRWNRNAAKEGVKALRGVGKDLVSIANGLDAFAKLTKRGDVFDATSGMLKTSFVESIKSAITGIGGAFAAVGGAGQVEKRFALFKWNRNAAKEGIKATRGVGKELVNIVDGLSGFANLAKDSAVFSRDGKLNQDFQRLVTSSVTGIGEAFAAIGGAKTVKSGWFMFKWDTNATKKGVSAVRGASAELNGIVDDINKFVSITKKHTDVFESDGSMSASFKNRIATAVSGIGDAFSSISDNGQTKKRVMFVSWSKNKVAEGIKSVKGVNTAMSGVIDGIEKFATLAKNSTIYSADGGFNGKFKNFITSSISGIGEVFAVIGGANVKGAVGFDKNAVKSGIATVNKVNKAVKNTASTYEDIAKTINNVGGTNPGEWITSQLLTTIHGFGVAEKKLSSGKKLGLIKDATKYTLAVTNGASKGAYKKQSESIVTMQKSINGINETKLKLVRDLYKAMGDMASGDPGKITRCCKAIENSLKAIYDIQKQRMSIDAEKTALERKRVEMERNNSTTKQTTNNDKPRNNENGQNVSVANPVISSNIKVDINGIVVKAHGNKIELEGHIETE